MTDQVDNSAEDFFPQSAGERLRFQREKLDMTVADVAGKTRVSQHHISNIESGDYGALPGRTYIMGFAKSMAKAVKLDPEEIAEMVRSDLNTFVPEEQEQRSTFEPGDPSRAPSSRLVWFSLLAVAILFVAIYFAARILFSPAAELPSLLSNDEPAEVAATVTEADRAQATPPSAQGVVVFTATDDDVWVKFYDAQNRRLMEKIMSNGESFIVPADAEGPQIWTGRPDALSITIDGTQISRLADDQITVRDVAIDAASLLARSGN